MTLFDRYHETWCAHMKAEQAIQAELEKIFGVPEPEDWWVDFSIDPVDWDGESIELNGAKPGLVPTEEQCEAIWALGFSVIRIDYAGVEPHAFSGDWWRVKGAPPRTCDHGYKP